MKKVITFKDQDCVEYDIIINEERVAYAVEYKEGFAEIYYDFYDEDPTEPLSSQEFDSIEDLEEFIYRNFED